MNETASMTWKSRLPALALVAALLLGGLGQGAMGTEAAKYRASALKVQEFSNDTQIALRNNAQATPSTITVSGLQEPIADVNVSLNLLSYPTTASLDFLLVGPGGQTALIMSDAGREALNDSLIFDDQATEQIPSFDDLVSGIFQPTNYDFVPAPDVFLPPAPTNPSSGSSLSVFNGTNGNGDWTLYIRDAQNLVTKAGSLSGWRLRITTANGVPRAEPDTFQAQAGKTLDVPAAGVLQNDSDPDDDALTAILAGQPVKGKVDLQPDGGFSYRPNKKAKGKDSFTYLAQDTTGLTDLETVTIQIKGKGKGKKHKKGRR